MTDIKHYIQGRIVDSKLNPVENGFVILREDPKGSEKLILDAARVSHGMPTNTIGQYDPSYNEKLIRFMWRHGHTSPFEHMSFTFLIKCPMFVARQWFRHRTGKYNEISGRYTKMDDHFWFPENGDLRNQSTTNHQCSGNETPSADNELKLAGESITNSYNSYEQLLLKGVSREQARVILPNSIMTKFYFTMDLHNLLHFLKLRLAEDAQPEIRYYAEAIRNIIKPFIPATWKAFEDFTLNIITFTAPEIEILKSLKLQIYFQTNGQFQSQREELEFKEKIIKLFK